MAFSTQKEFFHVPFMNETVDYECRRACVKLKSYDSTIDERSWAMDERLQSRFLTDLVTCQTPVTSGYGEGDGGTDDSGYGGTSGTGGAGGTGGRGGGKALQPSGASYSGALAAGRGAGANSGPSGGGYGSGSGAGRGGPAAGFGGAGSDGGASRGGPSGGAGRGVPNVGSGRAASDTGAGRGGPDAGAGQGGPYGGGLQSGGASRAEQNVGAGRGGQNGDGGRGGQNAGGGRGGPDGGAGEVRAGKSAAGLVGVDSVLTCANQSLGKLQEMLLHEKDLQKQLEVSNERLKVANLENEKIKAIMNEKFDSNHSKDFYNKIQKLASGGKISKGEENELLQIYNKFEDMGKAYEVLQAESAYLKRLMEKLSLRASFESIGVDQETSTDVPYLQKQINNLRKEVAILRKFEDEKLKQQFDSNRSISDQDAENLKAILKERNALREKCKTFKDLEKKVYDLQKKAKEADHMSGSLSSNLDSQTKYIGEMEHEMQRMQDYYEDQITKMKFNEELLKCQLEEMKEDLIRAKCEAQKAECFQMEIGCLRSELMRRDVALSDYDCQYKQLMTVIEELQTNAIQNLHDTQTQTCTDYIDDLAFLARATLNEIKKELAKRGADGDKISRTITNGGEECCAEVDHLQKTIDRISQEKAKLESNLNKLAEDMCADAMKRVKEMEDQVRKAKLDALNAQEEKDQMSVTAVEKLNEFSNRLNKLDSSMDQTSKETAGMNKDLNESIKLVKDISDVQMKNSQLQNAVNSINSRDDEKIIDDLRRQLLEEQKKNKKCSQENENLRNVLQNRGIDPDAAAIGKVKSEADKDRDSALKKGPGDGSAKGDSKLEKGAIDGPEKQRSKEVENQIKREPKDGDLSKTGLGGPDAGGPGTGTHSYDPGAGSPGTGSDGYGPGAGKVGPGPGAGGPGDAEDRSAGGPGAAGPGGAEDRTTGGPGGTEDQSAGGPGAGGPGGAEGRSAGGPGAGSPGAGGLGTETDGSGPRAEGPGAGIDGYGPDAGGPGAGGPDAVGPGAGGADTRADGYDPDTFGARVGTPDVRRLDIPGVRVASPHSQLPEAGQGRTGGTGTGRKSAGSRRPNAKGKEGQSAAEDPFQQFIDNNAATMKLNITAGAALEKELRAILNAFMQECGFCFCKSIIPKSKFYALCHKLLHCGIQCMNFRELAYIHRKIFMAAEKLHPGCMLNMILTEQGLKDGDGLKCCYCKNALCCSNSEEMLKEKVCKLERDIEMAKEYLDSLKTHTTTPKTPYTRGKTFRPLVEELHESVEDMLTCRETKIPAKCSSKQIKSLKARILKCSELLR